MSTQHSLGESKQISSASMDGLIIGANLENDEMNFIVPALSLENAAHEAALADGLIESGGRGSMRSKKMGLRRGKWTSEEENYANKLILEFKMGTLPLTDGTTLRTFLSKLLNCDPMRISKKFVGARCIGKQVFRRRSADIDKLSPEQIEANHQELADLERLFLDKVSQNTNKSKGGGGHEEEEEVVGGGVDDLAWPSNNAGGNSSGPAGAAGDRRGGGRGVTGSAPVPSGLQAMYASQMQHSDSTSEMLDFQNIMSSSGGLSQLASQALYYENLNPYHNYGSSGSGSGFPRQSSLEVLCQLDGSSGPNSLDFGGLYKNDSFNWVKSGELSGLSGGAGSSVDMNTINASYYSSSAASAAAANANRGGGGAGGKQLMVGPDGRFVEAPGNYYGGVGSSAGASLPYSSSAEWPSMNNLVVAAETIESLGSMNSLYGGGLVDSLMHPVPQQQQQQSKQEQFPFANQAQLNVNPNNGGGNGSMHGSLHSSVHGSMHGSTHGSNHGSANDSNYKPSPTHGGRESQNSLQYDRASNHSRASRASATPPTALMRDRSGSEGEAAMNMVGIFGGGNNSAVTAGGPAGAAAANNAPADDVVGYPIDEEEDEGPPSRGTNSVSNHSETSSTHALAIDRQAVQAVDNALAAAAASGVPLQQQDYTPITNMLRNESYYIDRLAQLRATYGDQGAYDMLNRPEGRATHGSLANMRLSAVSRNTSSLSVTSNVPKNSSISDFWMLVGLGDLPQPDTDVLSSTVFVNGGAGGGGSEKSSQTQTTETSTTATPAPVIITPEYPTGVPAHKPPGSPRIAPDLLPPHLRATALKHTRPASSDSLAGAEKNSANGGSDAGSANGAANFTATAGSSQKQQKKRVKLDGEDSLLDAGGDVPHAVTA